MTRGVSHSADLTVSIPAWKSGRPRSGLDPGYLVPGLMDILPSGSSAWVQPHLPDDALESRLPPEALEGWIHIQPDELGVFRGHRRFQLVHRRFLVTEGRVDVSTSWAFSRI